MRQFWMPRLRPMEQQCASCPFKDGNDKEFGAIHRRLAAAAGVPVHPVSVLTSRMRVRADIANAPSGDFICHSSAYTPEMTRRPMTQARQCPGATEFYKSGKTAPMDPYFAVFNQHINNAGERAKEKFIKKFGAAAWRTKMAPMYKDGIMAIFDRPPSVWTQFYVDAVTAFVNEEVIDA